MQTPQSIPSTSHPVLRWSRGARALGAALLVTTAFACSDPEEPEDFRTDIDRTASAPAAGPTPSQTASEADAPVSADDRPAFEGDAPAVTDDAPTFADDAGADDAPASEGDAGADDAPNRGSRICINACELAFDGKCDDGRPGSTTALCEPNMDCADCGSSLPSGPPS